MPPIVFPCWRPIAAVLRAAVATAAAAFPVATIAQPSWLPSGLPPLSEEGPALCPRDYLTPEQGEALLQATLAEFSDAAARKRYASDVRQQIQEGDGLAPWPRRTPLNAIVRNVREHDGYSVANVAIETVPGVWAAGNLFRPLGHEGPHAAILSTHGHTRGIDGPEGYDRHGRFGPWVQTRAAMFARAGAIVLTLDAFGYGDSIAQFGPDAHRTSTAMRARLWNAMRAVDFLSALPDVDASRIGVTGESGGGTQAFLLTAVDPRITASAPVVMVSGYFFGGCPCESGRPIHRSKEH